MMQNLVMQFMNLVMVTLIVIDCLALNLVHLFQEIESTALKGLGSRLSNYFTENQFNELFDKTRSSFSNCESLLHLNIRSTP